MVAQQSRALARHYSVFLALVALPLVLLVLGVAAVQYREQRTMHLALLEQDVRRERGALDAAISELLLAPPRTGRRLVADGAAEDELAVARATLARAKPLAGRYLLIDERGRVLADSAGSAGSAPPPGGNFYADLPDSVLTGLAAPMGGLVTEDGMHRLVLPLLAAPLKLVYVLREAELQRLVAAHLVPMLGVLAALVLTLVLAQRVLRRLFIRPALALVEHLRAESAGTAAVPPDLPRLWRPWLELISQTFAENRAYLARLEESEARFLAAAESLPDGLAIFDKDDRFVFFNSRYPEHLTDSLRATLAIGKRFSDWIREGVAQGPVYHPDLGADFAEHRLALHREPHADHEQRLFDDRWLRIRENRMTDGGRVLLTTDITDRKRQADALADQTAKLEAVLANIAEGVNIIDRNGRVILVNEGFMRLYGYPPELAEPGTPHEAFIRDRLARGERRRDEVGIDDLEALVARRLEAFRTIAGQTVEEDILADGRTVLIRRQRLPNGELVSTYADITELERRRRENALLAMAVEQSGDSVEVTDARYRIIYVNAAFTQLTGWTREEALGRTPKELLRSDQHDAAFFAEMEGTLERYDTWHGRLVSRHKSGRLIYQDAKIFPLRDAQGNVTHYVALKRDIGEREKAVQALRESEARYRAVVEGQSEFILRVRPNGTLSFVNDAYCRYRGLPRDELLAGFDDIAHYPTEEQAKIRANWARLTPTSPTVAYELRSVAADGATRYEAWTDTGIFDGDGRLIEVQAVGRDVTEAKRAEAALRASEARLRAIAEGVPVAVVITLTHEPEVLFANTIARASLGLEPGPQPERLRAVWVDRARRDEILERVRTDKRVDGMEADLRRADGSLMAALISARVIDYDGRPAILAAVVDITAQRQAETALLESEARLQAFMQHAPVGVHLKDREGRYLLANPEMAKVFGRPSEEVIGLVPADIFPPEEAAMIDRHHREVLETGRTVTYEEHQPSLAEYEWSMVIRFPIKDAAGAIIGVGTFAVAITEKKRAEAALRASEQRFRSIVHDQTEFISRYTPDFTITFVNEAYARQLNRPPEALLGTSLLDLMTDEQQARFKAQLAALTPEAPAISYEIDATRPDGTPGWEHWTERALYDAEGQVVEYQSVGRDVTERRRAEAAMRASEQRFRTIVEAHPVPVVIVALDERKVVFASRHFADLFRMPLEEAVGGDSVRLWADPADRERIIGRVLAEGGVTGVEVRFRRADGSVFWASLTTRLIEYEGRPAVVSGIIDLTERKAAEAEIARQREALHQSEKLTALGSLLAGVAHELNNPLSVVVGYSAMLQELAPDDGTRQRAAKIHAAAERCARIVKTFLAMARSKPPQRGPVSVEELIDGALELTGYGLRSAGVEVVREIAADLPPIWGDGDQLHQVVTNIVVNAQQALLLVAPPRRLTVRARTAGAMLRLEIEDNGPGIPEEIRHRIFDPFFTTKPVGVGTGVGLSVCLGIVTAHGGCIEVQSAPDQGSRFIILLPRGEALEGAVAAPDEVGAARKGACVLVVDDEAEIGQLVADALRRDGHRVEVVGNGKEALRRLERCAFDLIVSDLRMPDLDGPGLWRALRATRPELCRRLLFITGDTLRTEVDDFLRETGATVLEKPLDLALLRREVGARLTVH